MPGIELWRIRDWLQGVAAWRRRAALSYDDLRANLSPVFVIGGNRHGTSVVASVLAQHPSLEGLFGGHIDPTYNDEGHSIGFCESMHVWYHLLPDATRRRAANHQPFWALPTYVGEGYRGPSTDARERRRLLWSIERHRRTTRQPLIKDQFNMLRIGLIADLLPRARFVLVTRSWESFATRSLHKWATDSGGTDLGVPLAGFHWHMVNLIARYDLEIHAPGRYATVSLNRLHAGRESAGAEFTRAAATIALDPHPFDLSLLESQWAKPQRAGGIEDGPFVDVRTIVDYERAVLSELGGGKA